MDKFIGKWEVIETENLAEIIKALDMPCDVNQPLPMLEYSRSGDEWTMSVTMPTETKQFQFIIGQPVDMISFDGKPVKSMTVVEENKFVERYELDNQQNTVVRELLADDTLLVTVNCNGVTSTAKHKRIS